MVARPSTSPLPTRMGAGIDFADPKHWLARWYLTRLAVLAVALLGVLFLLLQTIPLWHTDIWGHLAVGRYVAQHGALPEGDPFTNFGDQVSPLVGHSWLGQWLLYQVFHLGEWLAGGDPLHQTAGGVELLTLMHSLLVVLRTGILLLAFWRLSGSGLAALFGVALLLTLQMGHLAVFRPQVFGELFLALILLALSRQELSRRATLAIPVIMVVWANCHGSYLTGFLVLGCAWLGRLLQVQPSWRHPSWQAVRRDRAWRRLTLTLLAALLLIGLATPSGFATIAHTLQMARHPNVLTMDEWQPLDRSLSNPPFQIYLGSLIVVLGLPLFRRRWYSPRDTLLLLAFALPPLVHQRAMVWWLLFVPWLVLPQFTASRLGRWSERLPNAAPCFRKTLLALACLGLVVWLSNPMAWLRTGAPRPLEQSVSQGTPWQLTAYLQSNTQLDWPEPIATMLGKIDPRQGAIFASEMVADYLIWTLTEPRLIVYSHVHLFSPEHWQRCLTVKWAEPGWQNVLDGWGVDFLLFEPELHTQLRQEVYRDPNWQVVVDEMGNPAKPHLRCRMLFAVRTPPQ